MVTPRYEPSLPKLGLSLPYRIAGLGFAFIEDYNTDGNLLGQGAGISLRYESEHDLSHADLFEYDWNEPDLPSGILCEPVIKEFFQAQAELQQGLESGYYTSLNYLEQRIVSAPADAGQTLNWLVASYMGGLPRSDEAFSANLRNSGQDPALSQAGIEDDDDSLLEFEAGHHSHSDDLQIDDEDPVLVHVMLLAFEGQFIKLRYTHEDIDDPEPEQRCFEFLNELSAALLQHRAE